MTETDNHKLDELLATAQAARKALNRRTIAFLAILAVMAVMMVQLLDIAAVNKINAQTGADNSELIKRATSPEVRAESDARLSRAINDIRRSIDCAALYVNDERPVACAEVSSRMDAIRSGLNPFAR